MCLSQNQHPPVEKSEGIVSNTAQTDQTQLHQFLDAHFDREEFRQLCFELGIKFDNLRGETLTNQAMELVLYMERNGRLAELTTKLQQLRPRFPLQLSFTTPPPPSPTTQQNPFGIAGKLQNNHHYFVRQPFTSQLLHELQKGVSLSLVGDSQTGKSSLLWHLCQGDQASPFTHRVYVDMQLVHSDEEFYEYLCDQLGLPTLTGYRLSRALKDHRVLLCLDEVEGLSWLSFHVRVNLRGLADGANTPFTLLIASRSPLSHLFPDTTEMTSPLAGLCVQMHLPPFTLAESHALVAQYLAGTGLTLSPAQVEAAWQQSNGHPYRLQQALKEVFNRYAHDS